MIKGIFDSHAHYDDEKFEKRGEEVISSLLSSGKVSGIVNAGDNIESSLASLTLAEKFSDVYAVCGIHPHHASEVNDDRYKELEKLWSHEKCVAIGEIGLDYHYDFSPREKQNEVFRAQMESAAKFGMKVCIHDREAHGDVLEVIRSCPETTGMMHSYSGSAEMARELVGRGYYISFSGSLTFKNAHNLRDAFLAVPRDRFMLETDSPYLAPVPRRGEINNSGNIEYIAGCISELTGEDAQTVIDTARENSLRFYGIND